MLSPFAGASVRCGQLQYVCLYDLQRSAVSFLISCRLQLLSCLVTERLLLQLLSCYFLMLIICRAADNSAIDARAYLWQRSSQKKFGLLKRVAMGYENALFYFPRDPGH